MKKTLSVFALAAALPCAALAESPPLSGTPMPTPETVDFEKAPDAKSGKFSIGANASVLGTGVEAGYRFNDQMGIRGTVATGDFSFNEEIEGNTFDGDIELGGYALMVDYYPTGKNMRLSAGALKMDHSASFSTTGSTTIAGNTYGVPMTVNSSFKNDITPVVSMGFQRPLFGSNFYLSGDIGAMYTGGVNVSATESTGLIPQSEIDAEISDIQDTLGKLKVAPFISVGVGITF